jgi:CHAT domain-containing protein/tetratricopeptide (TPR) repeat protein
VRFLCLGLLLLICAGWAQQTPPIDPATVQFAQQLFNAPTDEARAALLAAHPDLATPALIRAMNDLAGQVFDRGAIAQALSLYRIVLPLAHQVGDVRGEANVSLNLGLCLSNLFRPEEALAEYDRALALFRELKVTDGVVRVLNGIGIAFHRVGDLNTSLPYLEQALEEADRSGDAVGVAQSSTNLANLYKDVGRYRDAIRAFLRSLELIQGKPGMDRQRAKILHNLGNVYYDQHDLELALSHHQQALALKQKAGVTPADLSITVMGLGTDYQSMGEYEKSLQYFDRALQLTVDDSAGRGRSLVLYNYGQVLHRMGRAAEAGEKLSAALKLADRFHDQEAASGIHIVLGQIAFEQSRYADALREAEPIADYARRENIPRTLIRADDVIGRALSSLGRKAEAEAAFEEAIRTGERLRVELPGERQALARFMEDQVAVYRHMIDLQIESGRIDAALAYAERSKGRTLLDVLQNGGNAVVKGMTPEEREREDALSARLSSIGEQMAFESHRPVPDRKKLTALGGQMEKARNEYRAFESGLYAAHPRLRVGRVAFDPAAPGELVNELRSEDSALLEYAITETGAHLFVLTRSGSVPELQHFRVRADQTLERDIQAFRDQVAGRDLNYRKLGASLYARLIEPARQQLRGKSTLVIVPDGVLWQVPFQALLSPSNRHLLQDFAIFYSPSFSVLREMQRVHESREQPNPRLLAVDAALAPVTRREVEGLRQVYGPPNVRVFSGADADEERIKREAPNYQILHFNAHGVFQDRHPMDSYLVLAKAGKPEGGVLQAREMMNLDLRADLVVLSGCETGRGVLGSGEGLIGMTWALFIAGSPSTVASQWKVDAESTSQFMLDFHRRLRHQPKAKALQQAALTVMQKPEFRHPFYWSGFVLMGEGL